MAHTPLLDVLTTSPAFSEFIMFSQHTLILSHIVNKSWQLYKQVTRHFVQHISSFLVYILQEPFSIKGWKVQYKLCSLFSICLYELYTKFEKQLQFPSDQKIVDKS